MGQSSAGKRQKMLSLRKFLLFGIFSFFIFLAVYSYALFTKAAAPPSVITYQGKLLVSGAPASTTLSMKFVLYDALTGGNAHYTASGTLPATAAVSITPTSGLFSINLGDTVGVGDNPITNAIPDDFFSTYPDLYLEVIVGSQTLTPRKRLTSAPYAIHAATANTSTYATDAGTLDGFDSTYFVTSTHTQATSSINGIFSVTSGGTGTSTFAAGGIVFSDGTQLAQNPGNLFWDNSTARLGLGTTTPSSLLAVGGASYFDATTTLNSSLVTNNGLLYSTVGTTTNRITDPSFENPVSGWTDADAGDCVTSVTTTAFYYGSIGIAFQTGIGNAMATLLQTTTTLSASATYTLSYYAKGNTGVETTRVFLGTEDTSCNTSAPNTAFYNFSTGGWTCPANTDALTAVGSVWAWDTAVTSAFARYSRSFMTSSTVPVFSLYVAAGGNVAYASQLSYIDAVQLELGATASDFNTGVGTRAPIFAVQSSRAYSSSTWDVNYRVLSVRDSGNKEFLNMYGSGALKIGGWDVNGSLQISSTTDQQAIVFNSAGNSWIKTGNFGIGTTTPGTLLSVAGTSTLHNIIPDMTGGLYTNVGQYSIGASTTRWNQGWFNEMYIGSSTWKFSQPDVSRLGISNFNNGTEVMSILANGRIGVNTSSPVANFSVSGTTYLAGVTSMLDNVGIGGVINGAGASGVKLWIGGGNPAVPILFAISTSTDFGSVKVSVNEDGDMTVGGGNPSGESVFTVNNGLATFTNNVIVSGNLSIENGTLSNSWDVNAILDIRTSTISSTTIASATIVDLSVTAGTSTNFVVSEQLTATYVSSTNVTSTYLAVQGGSIMQNIMPEATLTYNIGAAATRWNDGWFKTMYIGTSTYWKIAQSADDRLAFITSTLSNNEIMSILTNGKVGIGTTTPEFKLDLDTDGGIIARGTLGSGTVLATSATGTRMIWYPRKAAFRAGYVDDGQWDDANIGDYSAAFGRKNIASGSASFAIGLSTSATGSEAFAGGQDTDVGGINSFGYGTDVNLQGIGGAGFGLYNNITNPATQGGFITGFHNLISAGNFTAMFGGYSTSTGSYSFLAGYNNQVTSDYAIALGRGMDISGTGSVGIGLDGTAYTLSQSNVFSVMGGNVGIGTTTPSSTLFVFGTAGGTGAWNNWSDETLKTNIVTLGGALDKVMSMRGVQFDWKDPTHDFPGKHIGFIAQEVLPIIPEVVHRLGGVYGMDYGSLTAVLVEAVKEQQAQIQALTIGMTSSSASVLQQLTVNGSTATVFVDKITFKNHVTFGEDTVGQAKILTGATSTYIGFVDAYDNLPVITVTPVGLHEVYFGVENATTTGFEIIINKPLAKDITFNWNAFAADKLKIHASDGTVSEIKIVMMADGTMSVPEPAPTGVAESGGVAPTVNAAPAEEIGPVSTETTTTPETVTSTVVDASTTMPSVEVVPVPVEIPVLLPPVPVDPVMPVVESPPPSEPAPVI